MSAEHNPRDAAEQEMEDQPLPSPQPLEILARDVQRDARRDAERYLEDSEVPAGGE